MNSADTTVEIRLIGADDIGLLRAANRLYGEVFADSDTYGGKPPTDAYLMRLLENDTFIALVALGGGEVVGALTAYELPKFERERSEVYIYDLAVSASMRRQGIATALIEATRNIAAQRGAWVVMIQADTGVEDEPAIALYSRLGKREHVLHFDIEVEGV